jgi:hypothetical protein
VALRDGSVARLAVIWTAWFLVLFGGFLAVLVASPEGVQVRISPAEATGALRWLLAIGGGLALVLPPAIVTYLWYLARLRKWSEQPDASVKPR